MNRVQNGILPSTTICDSAYISRAKAAPMNSRPRPNLRGIDGLARPRATQFQAMIGARVMMATELTDWNQAVGKVQSPIWRLTMFSARKVNELPASWRSRGRAAPCPRGCPQPAAARPAR
ncbi:hypothetical protein G6F54_014110 [Rhizopus delemar]|nr:hypothetical protein G6F54_014110 [Rhizopus delemar]